jgi:hypothetical protein
MTGKTQQRSLFEIKEHVRSGLHVWSGDVLPLLSALDPPALDAMNCEAIRRLIQDHVMACQDSDFLGCVRYRNEWLDVYRINWFAGIGLNLMKFTGNQAVVVAYYVDLVENEPVKLVPPHSSK